MISTFLVEHSWLPALVLIVAIAVGPLVGTVLAHRPRVAWWLFAISLVAVVGITMYPESRAVQPACQVALPNLSLGAVESIANIILFVPPVLLAGIATRRPALAFAGGVMLSASIELLQLAAPVFGRSCDTSDLITNAIGTAIGAALAAVALRLAAFRQRAR